MTMYQIEMRYMSSCVAILYSESIFEKRLKKTNSEVGISKEGREQAADWQQQHPKVEVDEDGGGTRCTESSLDYEIQQPTTLCTSTNNSFIIIILFSLTLSLSAAAATPPPLSPSSSSSSFSSSSSSSSSSLSSSAHRHHQSITITIL